MRITKFQSAVVHCVNAIILINLLGSAFLPTYLMAQTTTEEDEARIQEISKGQWDGALGVKSFTLPGVDTSPITTTDPVTGLPVEHSYKQSDGTYDFSTIKMGDMFQGFSQAQHTNFANELNDIRDNPHVVQDGVYQMELDKTTYANVECETLSTTDEQRQCELVRQASLLDEIRANPGEAEFMGANDSILTDFSSIADGTHPYYAELQNEECVETFSSGTEGEQGGVSTRNVCVVAANVPEQVCEAERYIQSTKVGEKTIVKYPLDPIPGVDIPGSGFEAYAIRECPNFDSTRRTCLELDLLTKTDIVRVNTSASSDEYARAQIGMQPSAMVLLDDAHRLRSYTVRSDHISPSMTLSNNLGQFIDSPEEFVVDPGTNLKSAESGFYLQVVQQDRCHPLTYMESDCPPTEEFVSNMSYGRYGDAHENADVFRTELAEWQFMLVPNPPTIFGLYQQYEIDPIEPPLLDQGFDNTRAPFTVSGETGTYEVPGGTSWYHIDNLSVHGYFPEKINVTDHTEYPSDDLVYYNFNRIQLVFTGKFSAENPAPPEPVDDSTTTIIKVLIDDLSTYPRVETLQVLGASIDAEISVFDQGTYGLSDYFPTNLRVVGDSVVDYTVKTIGRPTNRYEYEIEIEFDAIEPFEVIADIHSIDDQGFRPRAGEDPNCQGIIDLYTSGTVDGEAVCDFAVADDGLSRVTDNGVPIDWPHVGYFGFMPDWVFNGTSGLPNYCYEATISVDPSSTGGFASLDREVACSGLDQDDYDACMNGQYCTPDAVNGGLTCHDIGEDLQSSFDDVCSAYINDDNCTHVPNETRCEESIERDGETICLYESHVFDCTTPTEFSDIGSGSEREVDCGTPRDCVYGECSNIAAESNTAFLRANAAMQVIQEAKDNNCSVEFGDVDEATCRLFKGEAKRCKSPNIWGAADCCNPNELGMGSLNVVAYWQMYQVMDDLSERVDVASYMSEAWGAVENTGTGQAIGKGLGSISEFVTDFGSDAYTFMTKPIIAGWESTFQTLGFSPESEIVTAAADFFDMSSAVSGGQAAAEAATEESIDALSNTAEGSGAAVGGVADPNAITGVYSYLAHGVNNALAEIGGEELASEVFTVAADGSIGFADSSTGQFLNTASSVLGYIMLAYTIYNLYNLAVGIAFACDEQDFETTQKIKLLSTHYVGSWCSKKLFVGGCVEHSQGHCVYPSVFSRIISEQFKRIMAEDQGVSETDIWLMDPTKKAKPDNLDCHGFTVSEVTNIDWDRVDLSEYEEVVLATLKYDPNNMPEDFVKSDYLVESDGPQAGQTFKGAATAQAAVVGYASEQNRDAMDATATVLDDPDYMPWFDHGSAPDGDRCVVSCDTANDFYYNSEQGLCIKSERVPYPASFSCDTSNGYVLVEETTNNFTCRKADVVPLTSGCRDGFTLDTDTNLCTKDTVRYEDKIATCPSGYRLSNLEDACELVQTTPKETNCTAYGPGYSLVDGLCQQVTTETASPFLSCTGDGYIVESGECVLRTSLEPSRGCTPPYEYDPDADSCVEVSYDSMPATFSCAAYGSDYILSMGQCVKTTVTTGTLTCDTSAGYSLVDGACQKAVTGVFEATTTCPSGFTADPNDTSKCFKRTEVPPRPDPYCEDSTYTLIDDTYCQKIIDETVPAVPTCLSGYVFDGDSGLCVKVVTYPPSINCPDPGMTYDAQTGLCTSITHDSVPPTHVCEDGDTLVGTECQSSETIGYSISCPTSYVYNSDSSTCILESVDRQSPSYWCPIGTSRQADRCYEYEYTEPTKSCDAPKVFNSVTEMCEETVVITQPPLSLCPVPSYRDYSTGLCMVDEVIPADISCPQDANAPYTYNAVTELCERDLVDVQPSVFICPPEEVECNTADERDPVPQCADGSFNEQTGRCEDFSFTYPDAIAFCSDSNHFYNASTNRCEYMDTMNAVKCGPAMSPYFFYDNNAEECQQENSIGVIDGCVAGFSFDGTNCVRTMHTPMSCNDPTMTFNTTLDRCVKTDLEPAIVECQPPYVTDITNPNQCVLPPSHTPICSDEFVPVGYDTTSDRCRHLNGNAQHDAYLVCPPGSINQDNQYCYSGNQATPSCPAGYSFNAGTDRCEFTPTINWYCTGDTVLETDPDTGDLKCMYQEKRRPICPSSDQYYDIDLNRCVKEDIVQGTMVCNDAPPFYRHLDGTQCMTVARVPYESPDVCPDGYYPADPSYCEAQVPAQPPEFNCPAGYERNMDSPFDTESPRCVQYQEATPECDVGYTLVGNYCEQKHYAYEPVESCIYQGQTLFGDACQDGLQSVAPICPANHFYSTDYDTCLELTEDTPTFSCLSNNFSYDSNTGLCNSIYDEPPQCMNGYSHNPITDACEQILMAPVCDNANGFFYDPDLDVCRKYETEPADYFCDPGERDDGDGCTPVEEPTCNAGWVFEPQNDRCYRQENQPHEPNCEAPYIDFGGECVLQEAVDCSIYSGGYWDAATETCKDPQSIPAIADPCSGPNEVLINDYCYETSTPDCPVTAPTYNPATDMCEGTGQTPAYIHCASGEIDTGTGCTTQVPPSCPANYTFDAGSDQCYRIITQPYEPNCGVGEIEFGGECIEEVAVNCSVYGVGAYWDSGAEQCMLPDSLPATPDGCAAGEVLISDTCYPITSPQCPVSAPNYNSTTKMCEGTDNYPGTPFCDNGEYDTGTGCTPQVAPTCSAGYSFNASTDDCRKTESYTKDYECSSGTLEGTDCVEIEAVNCPAGYSDDDNDGTCTERTSVPADQLCDNGGTPPNCEEVDEYAATCPSGYTSYNNTTCSKTTENTSNPSCPSGLTYSHTYNECRDNTGTAPTESCPGGDTDSNPSNGCTSVDDDPGRITCSSGYSYNSSAEQCEKTEYVIKTCSSGSLQSDGSCIEDHGYIEYCDENKYLPASLINIDTRCWYRYRGTNDGGDIDWLLEQGFECTYDPRGAGLWHCTKDDGLQTRCDYTDVGGQCVEIFPNASCPGGYSSHDSTQCVRTVTQTPSCSGGYSWTGSTCSDTYDNGSYTQTCPAGEVLNNGQCYIPTTSYSCPAGSVLINNHAGSSYGDRCVETIVDYQSKLCPSGGTLESDGQCRTTSNGDDYYSCSSGILEGDECAFYDDQPGCDIAGGFVFYSGSNDCRKVSGADLEDCPAGWTDNGASCSRILTQSPNCNAGYYYEASTNSCQLVSDDPYEYDCGSDTYVGNGECSSDVSVTPSCNAGYTFYGSENYCRANSGSPQTYSCPVASPAYNLNGQTCERELSNPPHCDSGSYNSARGTCTFNHHPFAPNCNSPYVDANGQCEQYLTNPPICGAGEYYNTATNSCELVSENGYVYECYDNATQTYAGGGICTYDITEVPGCGAGYTYDASNNYCLEDSGALRPYSCPTADPAYTLNMGDRTCNRIVDNPPNCVNGSYESSLGVCLYGNIPHTPNCYAPYVDANGQCEAYYPEPPICNASHPDFNPVHDTCDAPKEAYNYECDTANGFTPIDGDITMCEKTTYENSTCPIAGQVLDTSDDQCKIYVYSSPSDQCDGLGFGAIRNGSNCETYYGQGYVTCQSGFRVDYDISRNNLVCHSEQTQSATMFCPFGYTLDGNSCVEVTTNDVDYSCSDGWSLVMSSNGFECQQFTGDVYPEYECQDPSSPLFDTEACRAQAVSDVGAVDYVCQGSGYEYDEDDHICRLPTEGYPVNEYCANPLYTLTPLAPEDIGPDGREYECIYEYVDTALPDLTCPDASPAYELRESGNCVRSEPVPSVDACEDGYTLSNDGSECQREVIQESMPNIICPDPYVATYGGECRITTITDATITCDPAESATGQCSMQIDPSSGQDQYGVFGEPLTFTSNTPFEVSITAACLELGQVCTLYGSSSGSGDAIYINSSHSALVVRVSGVSHQFALGSQVNAQMNNYYRVSRGFDNLLTVSVNDEALGDISLSGAVAFDRLLYQTGLGEHSSVDFSGAAISNYSAQPYTGHVYSMSCSDPSNVISDLNLTNDISLINVGGSGGPLTAYSGASYDDNVPPLPLSESEWDLVNGMCEKPALIDEVPPTLTCDGIINGDGECEGSVSYPAEISCDTDAGYAYNSLTFQCERTVIVNTPPSSITCSDPMHVLYDGLCQYSLTEMPTGLGCDPDYEFDSTTSTCGKYLVLTDEAVLCEAGDEQRVNICFERTYATPISDCPTNTIDIGGGQCQGTYIETMPASVSCSSGEIVGPNCVEEEIEPADVSCSDSSYQVLNNVCYRDIIASSVTPTETCLPGHTLENDGLCHFENIVPAKVECPDIEYSYDSNTQLCERTNVQNYRPDLGCPDDGNPWVAVSSTSCEMVTSTANVIRNCEDPTADSSGEQCRIEEEETHSPDFCQTPYELISGQCVMYEYEAPVISCPDLPNVIRVSNGCMEVIQTTQPPQTSC